MMQKEYKNKKYPFILYFFVIVAALLSSLQLIHADVPEKGEQLVYKLLAFNGKDYSHTFCREDADTFFVLANTDNFVSVRKTFVYFWPVTGHWNTDYETLDEIMEGYMEITESKSSGSKHITKESYTYFNLRGEYENNWHVLKDEEAFLELEKWHNMYYEYIEDVEKYRKEYELYRKRMDELLKGVNTGRKVGKDVTSILKEMASLQQPLEPTPPQYYTVPPAPVEEAFILNLPAGEYRVRFILYNGKVLEGSEKTVVSFVRRRGEGIGFDIIPGDRWTRPVQNKTPSSVIYVNGKTDLFLRPFYQDEYNDLYYNSLLRNDSRGNRHIYSWKRIQQVPRALIELIDRDGGKGLIREEPFVVEQVKGTSLGYSIVGYDPEGEHAGRPPNLIAFRIPKGSFKKSVKLRLLAENHNVIPNSEREIRIVRRGTYRHVPVLFILFPALSLFIVTGLRKRRHSR